MKSIITVQGIKIERNFDFDKVSVKEVDWIRLVGWNQVIVLPNNTFVRGPPTK